VTYHILSPKHSWSSSEYFKEFVKLGYKDFKEVKIPVWKDKVKEKGKSTPVFPLVDGFQYHRIEPAHYLDTYHFHQVTSECSGLSALDFTPKAIENQVNWLIKKGYLQPFQNTSKL